MCWNEVRVSSQQLKVELCGHRIELSENSKISIHKSTGGINIVTNNFTVWWASERVSEKEREK